MNEGLCRHIVGLRALSPMAQTEYGGLAPPCEGCGTFLLPLECHHRKFRSRGGLWKPSNILLLCTQCHLQATEETLWAQSHGWNIHTWEDSLLVPVTLWHTEVELWLDDEGGWTDIPISKVDNGWQ